MASEVEKEKQMLKSDLYGILDITREATDGEIKKVKSSHFLSLSYTFRVTFCIKKTIFVEFWMVIILLC